MNMKKLVSMLVAAALVCTMSTTAFAADQDGVGTGSYSANVKGTYQAGGSGAVVYSVDIAWTDMSFTYTGAGGGTWDPGPTSIAEALRGPGLPAMTPSP